LAKDNEAGIREGGIVLSVHARSSAEVDDAERALANAGGERTYRY